MVEWDAGAEAGRKRGKTMNAQSTQPGSYSTGCGRIRGRLLRWSHDGKRQRGFSRLTEAADTEIRLELLQTPTKPRTRLRRANARTIHSPQSGSGAVLN